MSGIELMDDLCYANHLGTDSVYQNSLSFDLQSVSGEDFVSAQENTVFNGLQSLNETVLCSEHQRAVCPLRQPARPAVGNWRERRVQIRTAQGQLETTVWVGVSPQTINTSTPSSSLLIQHSPVKVSKCDERLLSRNKSVGCPHENCTKLFPSTRALRKHVLCHAPPKHHCPLCGRAFNQRSKLNRHQLVHSGEQPFQCGVEGCAKRFSLLFNLKTHQRLHLDERAFVCGCCERAFSQASNLKAHSRTHLVTH